VSKRVDGVWDTVWYCYGAGTRGRSPYPVLGGRHARRHLGIRARDRLDGANVASQVNSTRYVAGTPRSLTGFGYISGSL
jgi:hypothetical protein